MKSVTAVVSVMAVAAVWLPCQAAWGRVQQTAAERGTPSLTAVRPNPADFVVHLAPPIDPAEVTVVYGLLNDRGGGSGGYAARDAHVRVAPALIAIDTTLDGRMAHALTAVIYVRGFRFAFVDVPSVADRRTASLTLVPLTTVPVGGQVAFGDRVMPGAHELEISYDASSMVKAFQDQARRRLSPVGAASFALTTTVVATASLTATGGFTAQVPDLLADPAVAAAPGALSFSLKGTPSHQLAFVGPPASATSVALPLARAYRRLDLRIVP